MRKYVTLPQNIIDVCILIKKAGFCIWQIFWDHLHKPKINLDVENWMEVM